MGRASAQRPELFASSSPRGLVRSAPLRPLRLRAGGRVPGHGLGPLCLEERAHQSVSPQAQWQPRPALCPARGGYLLRPRVWARLSCWWKQWPGSSFVMGRCQGSTNVWVACLPCRGRGHCSSVTVALACPSGVLWPSSWRWLSRMGPPLLFFLECSEFRGVVTFRDQAPYHGSAQPSLLLHTPRPPFPS